MCIDFHDYILDESDSFYLIENAFCLKFSHSHFKL